MSVIKSMLSAFLMYSKIPVPQVEWSESNRRYSLCFFPMIGAVIGALQLLWLYVCNMLCIGSVMYAVGAVLIPLLITGGIHMDGFCDVSDAKASYGSTQRRLEIMSDSHIGAFAVIKLAMYLLAVFGLFSLLYELSKQNQLNAAVITALGFILSRALSAIAAVCFRSAKSEGSLQSFVKPAHRNITLSVLAAIIISTAAAMFWVELISGLSAIIAAGLVFLYYRAFSYKNFGGITGDLAGYFLQLCELFILAAAAITFKIMEAAVL